MNKTFGVKQLTCLQMQAAMILQLQSCGMLKGLQDKSDEAFVQMRKAYDTGISGVVTISNGSQDIQADFSSNINNDYCIENLSQDGVQLDVYSVGGESYFSVSSSGVNVTIEGDIQQVFDEFGGQDEDYENIEVFKELVCPTNLIKLDRRKSTNVDFNDSDGTFTAKYTTELSNIFGEHTLNSLEDYLDESNISELVVVYQFDSKTLDLESIQITDENEQFDLARYEIKKTNTPVAIPESVKSQAIKWDDGTDDSYSDGYDYSDNYQSNYDNDLDYGDNQGQSDSGLSSGLDGWVKASDDAVDAVQSDDNTFIQASDMLNEKAVGGIFNPGQSLVGMNIAIGDQVVSIGVDTIDNLYNQFKQYGAEMSELSGSKSFQLYDDDAYVYIGSDDNGTVDYVQIEGLTALKACQIGEYQYGDTLSDFAGRHGEPISIYHSDYGDSVTYTYYYCKEYGPELELRASDGNTIDEITIYFND